MINDPRKNKEIEYRRRLDLYKQGLSDSEIAQECGVTRQTVASWRFRLKLRANLSPLEEKCREKEINLINVRKQLEATEARVIGLERRIDEFKLLTRTLLGKVIVGRELTWQIEYLRKRRISMEEIITCLTEETGISYSYLHSRVRTVIGKYLLSMCRKEPTCPFKPLLPETKVKSEQQ